MKADDVVKSRSEVIQEALAICAGAVEVPETRAGAKTLIELIGRLRDSSDCGRYLQGGLLVRLRGKGYWSKVVHEGQTFREVCEKQVGLKLRSCEYFMSIYTKAQELGLDPARLEKLGWTKARQILRVATAENLDAWIERTQGMTRDELEKATKTGRRAQAEKEGTLFSNVTVWCHEDEKAVIEASIDKAAELLSTRPGVTTSRGAALSAICGEWAVNHVEEASQSLAWHVARLEAAFGVKMAVEHREEPAPSPAAAAG